MKDITLSSEVSGRAGNLLCDQISEAKIGHVVLQMRKFFFAPLNELCFLSKYCSFKEKHKRRPRT